MGRQYTLSFNSMHRIIRGPSGEVSDAPALSQPDLTSPPLPERTGEPRAGGEHRSTSPFKGDGGEGVMKKEAVNSFQFVKVHNKYE